MVIQNFLRLYSIYSYYKILVIFPVLHHISLYLIYFIHSNLYLLIPFPLPTGNYQFVLYICESVPFLLYLLVF